MTQSRRSRVVEYSILIVIISMGTRQTFGIYLQPISESLGIGREVFSLAIATQNIIFTGYVFAQHGPIGRRAVYYAWLISRCGAEQYLLCGRAGCGGPSCRP